MTHQAVQNVFGHIFFALCTLVLAELSFLSSQHDVILSHSQYLLQKKKVIFSFLCIFIDSSRGSYLVEAIGLRNFPLLIIIVELFFGQSFHFLLELSFSFILIIVYLSLCAILVAFCISHSLFYLMPIYSNMHLVCIRL